MGGLRERVRFLRVGSLDNPDRFPPDVHIFTSSKQPWVILPPDDQAVEEFYDVDNTWSEESLSRLETLDQAAGMEKPWRQQRRPAK